MSPPPLFHHPLPYPSPTPTPTPQVRPGGIYGRPWPPPPQPQPPPSSHYSHSHFSSPPAPNQRGGMAIGVTGAHVPPPPFASHTQPYAAMARNVPDSGPSSSPQVPLGPNLAMLGTSHQHKPVQSSPRLQSNPNIQSPATQNFQGHGMLRVPATGSSGAPSPGSSQGLQAHTQPWLNGGNPQARPPLPSSNRPQMGSQTQQQRPQAPPQLQNSVSATSQQQQVSQAQQSQQPSSSGHQEHHGPQFSQSRVQQSIPNQPQEEESPIDIDMEAPLAAVYYQRKKQNTKRKNQAAEEVASEGFTASYGENHNEGEFSQGINAAEEVIPEGFTASYGENHNEGEFSQGIPEQEFPQGITVSEFDYSVENHFKAVDTISTLCGETGDFDPGVFHRLSSSIKFLREWREFSYPSRKLRFLSQNESNLGKDFVGAVTLPQFSSAAVLKKSAEKAEVTSESRKTFVMHVGGLVSALDWCPRVHSHSDSEFRSEFIAVAAHPPESSYHKIGAPVAGRGMVQIWCVLSSNRKICLAAPNPKKRKQRCALTEKSSEPKRPLGRPRKHPADASKNSAEQQPRGRPRKHPVDVNNNSVEQRPRGRPRKNSVDAISNSSEQLKPQAKRRKAALSTNCDVRTVAPPLENAVLPSQNIPTLANIPDTIGCNSIPIKCSIPNDVALPRLMFCLAHNGKVVWDLKWRPSSACDQQRMGNLAVLLGNGALEVWEVPFPHTVNSIYSDSQEDNADPRFIKLQPVFKCSTIKCGDRQSIPLSLEWSSSSPHDKILAGCHDGVVALWKFCATNSLEETRPLLCFSADTVPIRALSWAPVESSEGSNVVVTGGLKGLKFWDLRDPFSPLWAINPFQQMIYSLDWLPDPRCIIVAFEDGTLRILSLSKGGSDVPVTGEPFVGTQQKGYHSYYCSQFSIWSLHTSPSTGMVAYCGADGTALYFQLTTKAVERDPARNRTPHFLCGMLTEEESTLTMLTPLPNIPFPMKKTDSEWAQTPRSKRGVVSGSNQEKRAKEKLESVQRSDVDACAALCYDIDSEVEFRTNNESKASTSKKKTNGKNNAGGDEQAPLSIAKIEHNDADKRFESLPPKMVALHKVRWNVNAGSENWLCYGGAAGVLWCQEMDTF